jgi:hypothetical protein
MTHDVFGLGVAGRLLVQPLDRGHLLALFGCLDAVGNTDQAMTNAEGLEKLGTETHPKSGELIQIKPLAVEQMEEAVVGPVISPRTRT